MSGHLRKAGLVHRRVDAQRRLDSLRPEALAAVDAWLQPYRLFWAARMADLKSYVESPRAGGNNDDE